MSKNIFERILIIYSFLFVHGNPVTNLNHINREISQYNEENLLPNDITQNFPIIRLTLGYIRGQWLTSSRGRKFAAYKGIPYAQPPLGNLRFEPPQEGKPWYGVKNALNHGPQCTQFVLLVNRYVGDEDCLYLNLYIPQPDRGQEPRNSQDELLPIIIFIHGGAWALGSGDMDNYLYGPDRIMDEDVILVTINYRLGAMGFLYLENTIPGNMGLKDQSMALKMIKANAKSFGGDPNRIILMGESAGAASAEYHTLNPVTRKLISGVIAQSGSALAAWAWTKPSTLARRTRRLARTLKCPNNLNPSDIIYCLKRASAVDIARYQIFTDWSVLQLPIGVSFTPTSEPQGTPNAFLQDCPKDILAQLTRTGERVPYLTGYNTAEGQFFTKVAISLLDALIQAGSMKRIDFFRQPKSIAYLQQKPFIQQESPALIDNLLGDYQFKVPVIRASRYHASAGSDVYLYHFSFSGRNNFVRLFWNNQAPTHMDELTYLFEGRGLFGGLPRLEDASPEAAVSERLIRMWTNFAKTGNPTPLNNTRVNVYWPPGPNKLLNIGKELTVADSPLQTGWSGFVEKQCFI